MFTIERVINKLVEDVHKLWKCLNEQFESEKPSSVGQLLLLQLNSSHRLLQV